MFSRVSMNSLLNWLEWDSSFKMHGKLYKLVNFLSLMQLNGK